MRSLNHCLRWMGALSLVLWLAACGTTVEKQQNRFKRNMDKVEALLAKHPHMRPAVAAKLDGFNGEYKQIMAGAGEQKTELARLNSRIESYVKTLDPAVANAGKTVVAPGGTGKLNKPAPVKGGVAPGGAAVPGGKLGGAPGGMGAKPGMAPGGMGAKPGMAPAGMGAKPGMAAPGGMGAKPGMAAPGGMGAKPGMAPGGMGAKPGMAPAGGMGQPAKAPGATKTGAFKPAGGTAPAKPGMAPAKPGAAPAGKLGGKPAPAPAK